MAPTVFPADPALEAGLANVAEMLRRVTAEVRIDGRSVGSGVVWRPDGLIVTNAHVVQRDDADVRLWDGRSAPARLVRQDPARDLAALRIDVDSLQAAVPARTWDLRVGALVLAMGHPLGLRSALSFGVLHGAARRGARWIRADVRLAPGNSGGPLADAGGHVVGLNTMIADGLAHAIPSEAVLKFLDPGRQAVLGIGLRPVPLRAGGIGYVILRVLPRGAGARADLGIGDVLTAIDGQAFRDGHDLQAFLDAALPGDRVRVQIVRGFERLEREVTLDAVGGKARAA